MASLGAVAATPASAQRMTVEVGPRTGVVVEEHNPCLRAPAFRPAYCFRHEEWRRYAFNTDRDWRARMWREHMRREAERRANLEGRTYTYMR